MSLIDRRVSWFITIDQILFCKMILISKKHSLLFILIFIFLALRIFIGPSWTSVASKAGQVEEGKILSNLIKCLFLACPLYLIWRRYRYCRRFNQLPGLKTYLGIFGNINLLINTVKRTRSRGVATTELINSFYSISKTVDDEKKGIFTLWIGPQPVVFLTSPDLIGQMFAKYPHLKKGQFYEALRSLIGDGLITNSGQKWFYHRKLLTPAFNSKILDSFMPNMIYNVDTFLSRLEQEAQSNPHRMVSDLKKYIFPCSLDILCQSSMGVDVGAQLNPNSQFCHSFHIFMKIFIDITLEPWLWVQKYSFVRGLTSYGRRYNEQLGIYHDFTDKVIRERLAVISSEEKSHYLESKSQVKVSFMDTLIRENIKCPASFSLVDVRDEVNAFMAAGHDTTGWALMYVLFMIGHHPDVQAIVHQEVDNFLGNFESQSDITIDSLKDLKYVDAVLKETMRLYPPVPTIAKRAEEDLKLGQFEIPAGAEVAIGLFQIHRDPEYWSEPERFKPERFIESKVTHPYIYLPFSTGPRNCIGRRYAWIQVKSQFVFIMKQYTIESVDPVDSILTHGMPLAQTDSPMRVRIFRRNKWSFFSAK